jgi:hypothetical protein
MISGYVTVYDRETEAFRVETSDGRPWVIRLRGHTYAQVMRNLDEPYVDCTAQMRDMLVPGRYVYSYGTFYPESDGHVFEAQFQYCSARHSPCEAGIGLEHVATCR